MITLLASATAEAAEQSGIVETIKTTFGLNWPFFIAQVINFFLVVFILKKFAFGPIQQMLEQRRARIAEGEDAALLDPEVEALRGHEVTRETERVARRWAAEAVEALGALPKSAVKRGLERMADSIVTREG